MSYKQIEASREVRLWITQVILPAVGVVMLIPECRKSIATKAKDIVNKFKKT